jgi:hypothetical protein
MNMRALAGTIVVWLIDAGWALLVVALVVLIWAFLGDVPSFLYEGF